LVSRIFPRISLVYRPSEDDDGEEVQVFDDKGQALRHTVNSKARVYFRGRITEGESPFRAITDAEAAADLQRQITYNNLFEHHKKF
jgi:hypothetical protein